MELMEYEKKTYGSSEKITGRMYGPFEKDGTFPLEQPGKLLHLAVVCVTP